MQKTIDIVENKANFDELASYIEAQDASQGVLMQTLHKAQELFGYLPIEVQKFISEKTGIPMAEIYGVATFYTQFSLEPKGKHTVGVCMGTACYVKNAQLVLDKLASELKIPVGATTEDGLFTLEATRCLGCCGLAPVMMVGETVYGKVDPKDIPDIIKSYRE
ncbi:NAD(P)-dependent iron-only hydrogenase diaphorase component iron-sulfur protein [Dethiosulfatibacter aminovorans DSM 17477]|uniref:NAD(P)-dependent iron-only hydrogenase diaphorase component iron-sulfur protein n=1 Tax=Dethiosulfatibacter aminovorans DSM 17477 TaxID=1121476 RepID=A0A1M6AKI9_9FIRM|nr:NAD(P)-dependent iron-only hydrogenase diaphorase component iron-sulfur protein [Dethiosulfatibacter aminovorans DSM 17477]